MTHRGGDGHRRRYRNLVRQQNGQYQRRNLRHRLGRCGTTPQRICCGTHQTQTILLDARADVVLCVWVALVRDLVPCFSVMRQFAFPPFALRRPSTAAATDALEMFAARYGTAFCFWPRPPASAQGAATKFLVVTRGGYHMLNVNGCAVASRGKCGVLWVG